MAGEASKSPRRRDVHKTEELESQCSKRAQRKLNGTSQEKSKWPESSQEDGSTQYSHLTCMFLKIPQCLKIQENSSNPSTDLK